MKKTKIYLSAFLVFSFAMTAFADKGITYISPNNDGVQDNLEVPFQIKEKRYITEWSFVVKDGPEKDAKVIRTIGNKENRFQKLTVKTFFKKVVTAKASVLIPNAVVWNGLMDNNEVAPDGTYYYSISATDDNGNSASTKPIPVIVKNTPPEINLKQLSENEKIFGEGAKSTLQIKQSGSKEDMWLAQFFDSEGKVVRSIRWIDSEPPNFDWDGTDDSGMNVPDGVYSYRISATDRAGNKAAPVAITNIIFSAEKPVTNITINGSRYFSPNDDGILDSMLFDLTVPIPEAKTGNKLVSWKVSFVDGSGKEVDKREGKESAPSELVWDGKVGGKKLPEDSYTAILTAEYKNGYVPPEIKSPVFILDTIPPEATVVANEAVFSPDGDGNQDVLKIAQSFAENKGSPIKTWRGCITNTKNNIVVKEIEFSVPSSAYTNTYTWDGTTSVGNLADDSVYRYALSATDEAGNSATITAKDFALDTSKSEIILALQYPAFSPNGNGVQDTIKFTPSIKGGGIVKNYKFTIANEKGEVVYIDEKTSKLPASFIWDGNGSDGKKCSDGNYVASLLTVAENGSEAKASTQPFILDTVDPSAELKLSYNVFSRDGASKKSTLPVSSKSSKEDKWVVNVVDATEKTVKSWSYQGVIPDFAWDGTNEVGNIAPNGSYKIVASATDIAGNSTTVTVDKITLDSREVKSYVTADTDAFSPNPESIRKVVNFKLMTTPADGISTWSFNIIAENGQPVKSWTSETEKTLETSFQWDGKDSDGKVCEGYFVGKLLATYEKGNEVNTSSTGFLCVTTPPDISIKTSPQYFSPDNDGFDDDLDISLAASSLVGFKNWSLTIKDPTNGKPFWITNGKSAITPKIVWDGRGMGGELVQSAMDYPYEFVVTDELGLSSKKEGKINVDVLVIRDGNIFKMAVPAIIFRADNADFKTTKEVKNGIEPSQAANNERVLKRIAEILKKFKDYKVTIEGHANNISGTQQEETTPMNGSKYSLQELSKLRAEFVREELIKYGVDKSQIASAVGRGGEKRVAALNDKDNWWKNRRVEFILNK